ncbi:MAG: aminopeptidase [Bacilli bacterium]
MINPQFEKLAKTLCGHSTKISAGENVLLALWDTPVEMAEALIREVSERGAFPHVEIGNARIARALAKSSAGRRLETEAECALYKIKKMDAYIAVRGSANIFENSDVEHSRMAEISKAMKDAVDWRVNKTKWVVLRWPTPSMAQLAQMSTEAFETSILTYVQWIIPACSGMAAMKELMEKTDKVNIRGDGTDLHFRIKSMKAIPCGGQYNIPDGEIFTAPLRDSVNGIVTYNAPTIYNGVSFDRITLEFKDGKIVRADSPSNEKQLRQILSSDEGASYIGEFAMDSTLTLTSPCATYSSTRKSPVHSISLQARHIRKPTMGTSPESTGIWCAYKLRNTAAEKFFSTES